MSVHFLIIILVARYLRSSLVEPELIAAWSKRLLLIMYASAALLIFSILSSYEKTLDAIGAVSLAAFAWLLNSQPAFKKARFILLAIVPFIVVSLISDFLKIVSNNYYSQWKELLNNSEVFAIIWGLGVWLIVRRQNKELTKAQQKALQEEQNSRAVSAMNDSLEWQVAQRTAEITKQKEELEQTLEELKATQSQLIQSEKMASLGELTAGIAHEIQNPLNFVNNFSEVSAELIADMKEELKNGNAGEVQLIADDLQENLVRITQHGKRADAIVKSMLQHSKKNTGQQEPTDINALADEYLRLSYHGLRAKDKTFNATMLTDFDGTTGKINIVPQDMGRVLLNLFNNAFYAVSEKKQNLPDTDYKPTVSVSTKKLQDSIQIVVKDNGNGIPQTVIDKIFQPFFSTKPTGKGTGLGLSLSYDIVTRQHGGTIVAETKEGEGATFIIGLPFK